jgi:hypothetical protein
MRGATGRRRRRRTARIQPAQAVPASGDAPDGQGHTREGSATPYDAGRGSICRLLARFVAIIVNGEGKIFAGVPGRALLKKWLNHADLRSAEHATGNPGPHERCQPSTDTLVGASVAAFRACSSPIALHLSSPAKGRGRGGLRPEPLRPWSDTRAGSLSSKPQARALRVSHR